MKCYWEGLWSENVGGDLVTGKVRGGVGGELPGSRSAEASEGEGAGRAHVPLPSPSLTGAQPPLSQTHPRRSSPPRPHPALSQCPSLALTPESAAFSPDPPPAPALSSPQLGLREPSLPGDASVGSVRAPARQRQPLSRGALLLVDFSLGLRPSASSSVIGA